MYLICLQWYYEIHGKLTWLVLVGDPAARSHRVKQFAAHKGVQRPRSLRWTPPLHFSRDAVSLRAAANTLACKLSANRYTTRAHPNETHIARGTGGGRTR
jgi:hypothetical protein